MKRDELEKGLALPPAYMSDRASGRDINSILRHEPITGARFNDAWEFLAQA